MKNLVFKEGDRVYFHVYGWGKIFDIDVNVGVKFENVESYKYFNIELLKALSFTEYTLNGFSQERPEELPEKGQVVWVRDEHDLWKVSMFLEYDINEPDGPYIVSPNMIEGDHECYRYLTKINPYLNEKTEA